MNEKILIPTIFGEEIGILMENKNGVSFQYSPSFDAKKYPISPLSLPYSKNRVFNYYDSISTKGLPGIFADSLPDSFGNIAMREYFKRKHNRPQFNLCILEKLAYVGDRGIGAIEYKPSLDDNDYNIIVDLQNYAEEIKSLTKGNMEDVLDNFLANPSPAGARPKASVLWNQKDNTIAMSEKSINPKEYEAWIIKFDEELKDTTKIEFVYMSIAKEIGIEVPEFKHIHIKDETHFAIKRFDRDNNTKLHQSTLAGLTHLDFMRHNVYTYEEYLKFSELLTMSSNSTKEAFRRMVFNVIGKNCDDHLKNFSFLMDSRGDWRLSPAYDLVYSFGDFDYGEHKMSINGRNSEISINELAQCGYYVGLEKNFMIEVIEKANELFNNSLEKRLKEVEVSKDMIDEIIKEVKPISFSTSTFPKKILNKKIVRGRLKNYQ